MCLFSKLVAPESTPSAWHVLLSCYLAKLLKHTRENNKNKGWEIKLLKWSKPWNGVKRAKNRWREVAGSILANKDFSGSTTELLEFLTHTHKYPHTCTRQSPMSHPNYLFELFSLKFWQFSGEFRFGFPSPTSRSLPNIFRGVNLCRLICLPPLGLVSNLPWPGRQSAGKFPRF